MNKPKLPEGWRLGKVTQRQLIAYEDAMREAGKAVPESEKWLAARRQRDMVQAALDAGWFAAPSMKDGETADDLDPAVVRRVFLVVITAYGEFVSIDPNE